MRSDDTQRHALHLFLPTAFLVLSSLFAVFSFWPASSTNEPTTTAGAFAARTLNAGTVDAETTPHAHVSAGDETTDGHIHEMGTTTEAAIHQHSTEIGSSSETIASNGHAHEPTVPGTEPTGPIVSVDDPRLTPAQQDAARSLLVATRSTIATLPNVEALTAAGYVSVGDNSSGLQHWVNDANTKDGRELDPSRVESFMVKTSSGLVVGAMYMLEPAKTMANVPDIAGELTTWHVHQPICFRTDQIWRFVSFAKNGNCAPGSAARNVPPMIHVWADDPKCGPFVGTEGHGASTCDAHPH